MYWNVTSGSYSPVVVACARVDYTMLWFRRLFINTNITRRAVTSALVLFVIFHKLNIYCQMLHWAVAERPRDMLRVIQYFAKSLKVTQTDTIRKLVYGFLFTFHSNYGSVLCHFRDKARYWSKITIFSYRLHSTYSLSLGGSPSEYWYTVWCWKTRLMWLPDGGKSLKIRLAV